MLLEQTKDFPRLHFVSRHAGAIDWLRCLADPDCIHDRLDPKDISSGDVVAGNLPIHLAAEICARGATYLHLRVLVPEALRGSELSAEQLRELGAELRKVEVKESGVDAALVLRGTRRSD